MTTEAKARAYDEAMNKIKPLYEQAKKDDNPIWSTYEYLLPELREEEKPLTPFQQCLNCILRGVYYAEVPDKKVNEFIVNTVKTRTDELIKLAKKHEHADCQLNKSDDERIRKYLIDELKAAKSIGELKFTVPQPTREECISYLEKQKEQKPVDDKAFEEWIDGWWKEHKEKAYTQITMDEKEFKNFCRGIRNMYAEQKSVPISYSHENGTPAEVCYGPKGDPDPAGVWKPSEEQMMALEDTLSDMPEHYKPKCTLETLLLDLKKLM